MFFLAGVIIGVLTSFSIMDKLFRRKMAKQCAKSYQEGFEAGCGLNSVFTRDDIVPNLK